MVCISCIIAPLVLFIWYKFIYPILQPIIQRIWNNYQLPQPFANLTCPLPQKKNKCNNDSNKTSIDDNIDSNQQQNEVLATDQQKKEL
jgi:hypothetical protein